MTQATEDSLREGRLKRRETKTQLASTRNAGKGSTSHDYIRKGTGKSAYQGSKYSS